jgi:hypothetical protein
MRALYDSPSEVAKDLRGRLGREFWYANLLMEKQNLFSNLDDTRDNFQGHIK